MGVSWDGLSSVLYFLAFGLLFYWMMRRGGCGMHGHGGHAQHHGGPTQDSGAGEAHRMEVDPICGMPVDPGRAAGTRTIGRTTFYMCSADCLAKFDHDAARLARNAGSGNRP